MITIDEFADFAARCHKTVELAAKRIRELEEENKVLLAKYEPKKPKE